MVNDPDITYITTNRKLDFKREYSESTGEVSNKIVAEHHFCKIVIYDSGRTLFKGSIHKLWNSLYEIKAPNFKNELKYKGYNGNEFTYSQILEVRKYLESLLNCEPHQMRFQNIEFGINTNPKFKPKLFLFGLLYHNPKNFNFDHDNNYAEVSHQRYRIKIYNKTYQYGMHTDTLRIEVSYKKMDEVNKKSIESFQDINKETLKSIFNLLLKRFDEVIHYDKTINKRNLSKGQKNMLKDYYHPHYWLELTKQERDYHKKRLTMFTSNYSNNIKESLRKDMIEKFKILNT